MKPARQKYGTKWKNECYTGNVGDKECHKAKCEILSV
jgi:hypothetical protein